MSGNPLSAEFIQSVIEQACVIQAIPAPTFQEARRASYFVDDFRELGLSDIQLDAAGNVLARLPGRGQARPLVISAHMDTVFPMETPLALHIAGDRIAGPGIGDNALGLAAAAGIVRLLKKQKIALPGDVWLAMNVGEEGLGDLRGIQAIADRFKDEPLAYLVIEGMGLGTVLHRGLGVERYKISVQTAGGHSWVDYGLPSAIHELARLVVHLANLPLPQTPATTLNVGIIHGGTSVNTIASQAYLELDLRSEDSAALADLVKQVFQIAERIRRPGVQVYLDRIGKRQAGSIPEQHPLVRLAQEVLDELGIETRLDIASTDANLPLSRGFPAICLGVTCGSSSHSLDEYIQTPPVGLGLAQLYLMLTRIWNRLG